ncbi:NAD(P)-dependent dehydrogenase, short-chain alcohol dehydrogenase family [Microlunatus sagamiharensis]|uniref:NAD(P)-dependent dehydrogenase, short-chain alcohol dehydrogenase family n=1 Tax=Microlunatus sagamiharensis TaxID=546874 RepID=A0A1H2LKC7_9ACTN|nr:SDR family NAD(P)-dependent oxidoreductase [Microlunatus sagamiharensis]SDU81254.1 NAD(P)-dependent dehydrogenase, short-chain alcohol dehydrogenase family [Microlunatus sagamiharensis]
MTDHRPTALVLGASRTIGLAVVEELVHRGWDVVGTVRRPGRTALHDLADRSAGRVEVETADLTDRGSLVALRRRLDGRPLDLVLVNGAITQGDVPGSDVTPESFTEVMLTNAWGPMVAVGVLGDLVAESGTVAVMSSSQGSIALNSNGGHDVYRASKSALNQLMRSHVARHADDPRTFLLLNPGHIQTDLGGPGAPLTIEEAVPDVVGTLVSVAGRGGLHFLDRFGQTVPW